MDIKYYQQDNWSKLKMQESNKNMYHMNDQEIIQNFNSIFQQLTFNSKPIISDLTDLAKKSSKMAPKIVEIIENHLKNVPNHQKLPILYLMDSICKNIGGIYLSLFSINLTKIFGQTYNLVDSDTQMKLKRLVNTWKDYPKGPLFPSNILESLNNIINQFQKDDSAVNKTILKKAINSIQTLLMQKLNYQKQYPFDESNNQHIQYLYKAMQILQDPSVTDLQISRFNQEITNNFQSNSGINSPINSIPNQVNNLINNQIPNTMQQQQPMMNNNVLPINMQNPMQPLMMNNPSTLSNTLQSTMPQSMNTLPGIPNPMRNTMMPNTMPNLIPNPMVNPIQRNVPNASTPNTHTNIIKNSMAANTTTNLNGMPNMPNSMPNTNTINAMNGLPNAMTTNPNSLGSLQGIPNVLPNTMTSNATGIPNINVMGPAINGLPNTINNLNGLRNPMGQMGNTSMSNPLPTMNNVNGIMTNNIAMTNSMSSHTLANSLTSSTLSNSLPISSLPTSLTSTMPSVIQSSIVTPNITPQNIPLFLSSLPVLNNITKQQQAVTATSSTVASSATLVANNEQGDILSNAPKTSVKPKEEPTKKYETFDDFPSIKITDEDIHKPHPEYIEAIYDFLSYQCKQCGRRYYKGKEDNNESEKKIYSHLDWHFRQNRRLKNQSKQILSRGWQDVSEDDWINSKTIEGKFSAPTFFQFDSSTNSEMETSNNDSNKEETQYLPCDGTPKKCFVCNEDFEKHWHEDEEEWMLKDAIERDNKVFHPSCYEDYISQQKAKNEENTIKNEDEDKEMPTEESSNQSAKEDISDQSTKEDISDQSVKKESEGQNNYAPVKRSISEVESDNNEETEDMKKIKSE